MGIRDVIAGDLTNDELIICNDEDVVFEENLVVRL